jgi:hypothetical protein
MTMANLTQDQINQLMQAYGQQGLGGNTQINGQYFAPAGVQSVTDGGVQNTLNGFSQYDPNHLNPGDSYQYFDPNGQSAGTRQWQNGNDPKMLMLALAAAGGMGAFLPGGFMAGGAGMGGAGLGAEVDPMMYGGSGAGTWGGAANTAAMGASGAAGAAPAGVFNPAVDSQLASSQLGLTAADTGIANGIPSVGGAGNVAASSGNWWDSILPKGAGGLLAPIIGAALGSKGQQSSTTQTRDIPDWLKPYVQKQLGYAGGLLDQQMKPEYMQGATDIRNQALQGLLAGPQQNANFARFFPGH